MSSKKGKVLNPFQHALKRPDTYIGSKVTSKKVCWVFDEGSDEDGASLPEAKIVSRKIKYNPGLIRIFIEVMSNAIDNLWRSQKHGETMKKIEFTICTDPTSESYGWITIKNDGYCIPVQKEEYEFEDYRTGKIRKEELYPVEVFFGEMLAGTNFEEDETRKTSGRNGMGGKAMVIFSQEAIIEHTNPEQGKKLVQTYSDHGTQRSKPVVTTAKGKIGYTSVSFLPDYEYFDYPGMDEDLYSILKRHIYECSMITGLNVSLNGERITVQNLNKYVRLYYPNTKENCLVAFKAPNGDECVLVERGLPDMDAQEDVPYVSWINGIHTRDGGVHVEAWKKAIFPLLVTSFNSRKVKKGEQPLKTTAKELYPYFTLFVRAEIEGAMFDAQTKDRLEGPEVKLADSKKDKDDFKSILGTAMKKILKWNFIALLEEKLSLKAEKSQSRKEKVEKRVGATKNYTPANLAGTRRSPECILAIEEGLSAKTFFGRIISKIKDGNDLYGSLAIRGKFINVQNASLRDINANAEVQMLK
jgi:DNA topoisomerase-2